MRKTVVLLGALGGALLLVPACVGCVTGMTTETVCDQSGGGTIDAPPDLGLTNTLQTFDVQCASNVSGQCYGGGSFYLTSGAAPSMASSLSGYVLFPRVVGNNTPTFTFPVPAGSPASLNSAATFTLSTPTSTSGLAVTSGTVTIEHQTSSGYSATYAFTLQASSGEVISITGGHATVANCHSEEVCTY